MKQWAGQFIENNGDRLIYMLIATMFGVFFYYVGLSGEAKTLLIAVATLALNKARGPEKKDNPDAKPKG